jgi:MFS family permease
VKKNSWLTKSILGIGLTSLLSDMGHEMTTAILPVFLATIGGTAATLGLIEGIADASSSFIKLWMGYYSDKIGKRKPIIVVGYVMTAIKGLFAFTTNWYQVLFIRVFAWMGRGARGPVRDALMVDLLKPAHLWKGLWFSYCYGHIGRYYRTCHSVCSYRDIKLPPYFPYFFHTGFPFGSMFYSFGEGKEKEA